VYRCGDYPARVTSIAEYFESSVDLRRIVQPRSYITLVTRTLRTYLLLAADRSQVSTDNEVSFLRFQRELFVIMSLVRQNFHEECEDALNKQINLELYASYVYLSMVSIDQIQLLTCRHFSGPRSKHLVQHLSLVGGALTQSFLFFVFSCAFRYSLVSICTLRRNCTATMKELAKKDIFI